MSTDSNGYVRPEIPVETDWLEALHKVFDGVRAGEAERIITYCGGGVNATVDALALIVLGYENVAVYDGSMSEWGNDHTLPLETGSPA